MAEKDQDDDETPEEGDGTIAVNDAWTGMLAISLLALIIASVFLAWQWYDMPEKGPEPFKFYTTKAPGAAVKPAPPKVDENKDKDKDKDKDDKGKEKEKEKEKDKAQIQFDSNDTEIAALEPPADFVARFVGRDSDPVFLACESDGIGNLPHERRAWSPLFSERISILACPL